jgi:hypothetical protein
LFFVDFFCVLLMLLMWLDEFIEPMFEGIGDAAPATVGAPMNAMRARAVRRRDRIVATSRFGFTG